MSTHTSDCIELAVMRSLCKRIRSDFGRRLLHDVNHGGYGDIPMSPADYNCPTAYAKDYLLHSFLRKWKGWKHDDLKPHQKAFSNWIEAESLCAKTNHRFENFDLPSWALPLISEMQRKISKVLGVCDEPSVFEGCRWSTGATADLRRPDAHVANKMSRVITVTRRALPHLYNVVDEAWRTNAGPVPYRIVRSNRGVMVAKTSKTDRPIAAEPTGNAFLQQGVGRYIRRRLKGFDVDLDSQTRNQEDAFRAVIDGLATVDLSSASDTLSLSVVRLLLPPDWYQLLSDLRSPVTTWASEGKRYYLAKFSSMGNAFTFELESLIFWALAKTVSEMYASGYCSVYGDDIIVPASCYGELHAALEFFGFVPNKDKSFSSGLFYESCGKQYFALEDVTPVYQKELVGKDLAQLIRLYNRLYRWGNRTSLTYIVKDALQLILDRISLEHPRLKKLPRIPEGHPGDMGLLTPHAELTENKNRDFTCTVLLSQPLTIGLVWDRWLRGVYAYKMRESSYENALPNGHAGLVIGETTRIVRCVVWRSSLHT